jgi:hypothetical protein
MNWVNWFVENTGNIVGACAAVSAFVPEFGIVTKIVNFIGFNFGEAKNLK